MNPEFQRNVWTELSARRLIAVPLVAFAFAVPTVLATEEGWATSIRELFSTFFIAIVIVGGTWLAANSVLGEIRDRTWDAQRLSALMPLEMMIGKLFGSTVFAWYAGAWCLAFVAVGYLFSAGIVLMVFEVLYLIFIGLFAHAVALMLSLLGIQKNASFKGRYSPVFYVVGGFFAAGLAASAWTAARFGEEQIYVFYSVVLTAQTFLILSLITFSLWTVIANYRLMRLELQLENRPLVWLAFVIFVGFYFGGAAHLQNISDVGIDMRLVSAGAALAGLTYVSLFLDRKDLPTIRRLETALAQGNFGALFMRLPGWLISYFAVFVVLVAWTLVFRPGANLQWLFDLTDRFEPAQIPYMAFAAFLFLTRDVLIFLYFNLSADRKRGDFAAVLTLFILYAILPWFVTLTLGVESMVALMPYPSDPGWLTVGFAAAHVVVMLVLVTLRYRPVSAAALARQ